MTVKVTKPALNLREELSSLKKPSGVAGEAMLRAETPQEQFNLIGAGRKNLIINGGFDVWQRGTSFNNIASQYCADRWNYVRAHTVDVDRVACDLDGFKYATKITNETAGTCTLYQFIENTGQFYAGQELTLSYWVRASEAGIVRSGRTWNGSTYVTNYHEYTLPTTWERKEFKITVTSNWTGSETYFGLQVISASNTAMSAGSWVEVTGVQLELGSVATPFEHRSYGEELALCQRYYVHSVLATSTGDGNMTYLRACSTWPVTMRTTPTMSVYDNAGNVGKVSHDATNNISAGIGGNAVSFYFNPLNVTTGLNVFMTGYARADAEL